MSLHMKTIKIFLIVQLQYRFSWEPIRVTKKSQTLFWPLLANWYSPVCLDVGINAEAGNSEK